MTHYHVVIQLPLHYNPVKGEEKRQKISAEDFRKTYIELLEMVGGVNTSNTPISGAWKNPKTKQNFFDENIAFNVLVETEDKKTLTNIPKMKKLVDYCSVESSLFTEDTISSEIVCKVLAIHIPFLLIEHLPT